MDRARVGSFTGEQLREIELDENTVRLDLTAFEVSKAKLRQIEAAEREAEEEAAAAGKPAQAAPVSGGRGEEGGRSRCP